MTLIIRFSLLHRATSQKKKRHHPKTKRLSPPGGSSEGTGPAGGTGPALIRTAINGKTGTLYRGVQAGQQGLWQPGESELPDILREGKIPRGRSAGGGARVGRAQGWRSPVFSPARCRPAPAAADGGADEGRGGSGVFIALNFPLCYLPRVRKCSRTGNTAAISSPG